ncbi:MAG: hypothetical protein ACK5LQ_05900 [Planctomycetota bacterium]
MDAHDETSITDLEIMPDGRIFVFGASSPILEILAELQSLKDSSVSARLQNQQPDHASTNISGIANCLGSIDGTDN